jgi:NADH:ubiquinone oxidoreductase subunit 6 (subunit J)
MNERSRRGAAAVAGLLGLLAVVAIAAGGRGPGGGRGEPSASAPTLLLDYLTTFAILVFAAAGAALFLALVLRRLYEPEPQTESFERKTARTLIRATVVVALVVVVISQGLRLIGRNDEQQPTAPVPTAPGALTDGDQAAGGRYEPRFQWLPVLVVGALVVGIASVGTVAAVRRRRRVLAEAPVAEALSDVLAESLDDLESERDPRRAVIRAYAQMERVFAARGLPRRKSEAPAEYVTRLLDAAGVSAHSVRRLTNLFARARFSTHEVDVGMKGEAIEALGGLRAEIEAMG